jgi:hypothetical protein
MAQTVPVAPSPIRLDLRQEALRLLDGRGAILETARELTSLMRAAGIDGAVIGGIAVVLHGHIRTTRDIDIFIDGPAGPFAELLAKAGFVHDPARREFVRDGLPVHLVLLDQLGMTPTHRIEIDAVATVSLADLIEMKLRSGSANLLRAQDLADVIGLIRRHQLTREFAKHLDKSIRPAFRKLARAVAIENS